MSEIEVKPISHALGDRNAPVKIERSWSEDVPVTVGADAPIIKELEREQMIVKASGKSGRRAEMGQVEVQQTNGNRSQTGVASTHHFFVIGGNKLEFIGSKEVDVSKFQKDISGRSYRVWLKTAFPDRTDYDDIVIWWDNFTVR